MIVKSERFIPTLAIVGTRDYILYDGFMSPVPVDYLHVKAVFHYGTRFYMYNTLSSGCVFH